MKASPTLYQLIRQCFQEADDDLQRRKAKWARLYRNWRGVYSQDEDQAKTGVAGTLKETWTEFSTDEGLEVATPSPYSVFIRQTFVDVETVLSYLEEAYTAPPKPFEVSPPRIWARRPDRGSMIRLAQEMRGIDAYLTQDYRDNGSLRAHLEAFRDALIFGTGFCLHREAEPVPYPRAIIERLRPWRCLCDPFSDTIRQAKYWGYRHFMTVAEAIERWPADEEAIRKTASSHKEGAEELEPSVSTDRQEVPVVELWIRADLRTVENLLDAEEALAAGPDRQWWRLYILAREAEPTETILEITRQPYRHAEIPVQEFSILRSPVEQGPYGIGIADLDEENQALTNSFWNNLLVQFGYATLQGGLVDATADPRVLEALQNGIAPGQWTVVPSGTRPLKESFFPLSQLYSNYTPAHAQMLELLRRENSRLTAVNDANASGLTVETQSRTASEASLLQQLGVRRIRMAANHLDVQVRRSLRLYATTAADALQGATPAEAAGNPEAAILWWVDENGQAFPIRPESFDEPWEIRILAGATWISEQGQATELLQLAGMAKQAGELQTMRAAIRKVAYIKNINPDLVTTPQEQMAQLAAMAAANAGAPTALPEPETVQIPQPVPSAPFMAPRPVGGEG